MTHQYLLLPLPRAGDDEPGSEDRRGFLLLLPPPALSSSRSGERGVNFLPPELQQRQGYRIKMLS